MPPKNDAYLMSSRLFYVDENGAECEISCKESGFDEVEFSEKTLCCEKLNEVIRRLSKSLEISVNVIKIFGDVSRKYLHRNMSNNWLKMHGIPMRRRQWKQ